MDLGKRRPHKYQRLPQTPDGYLWIGTDEGLYRFDGIEFERPPGIQVNHTHSDAISELRVGKNGDLWIGYGRGGACVLRKGLLEEANPTPAGGPVISVVQTKDGAIWMAMKGRPATAQLRRFLNGRWVIINSGERSLPTADLIDILAAYDSWAMLLPSRILTPTTD